MRPGRRRLAGLAAVLGLLAGALVLGLRGEGTGGTTAAVGGPAGLADARYAAARASAALPACPVGLTPDLPDLRLPCYAGGPDVTASAAPGRPLLVNLWATWCAPCVDEVPALVSFAGRAAGRVDVVGVVVQDSPDSVYAFAKAFGIDYPLVDDALGEVARHYGPGVPKTLLVTADGRVAHVQVAAFPSEDAVADAVASHLGVRL